MKFVYICNINSKLLNLKIMIKKIIIFSLLVFTIQFSFGQNVFRKGKTGINLGGGIRTIGIFSYGGNLSLERSIYKINNTGDIGVGLNGEILFVNGIRIESGSMRVAYHTSFFRNRFFDLYSGIGVAISKKETQVSSLFYPDAFLGFRYKFKRKGKIGLFGELEYFGANFKAGICFIL